MNCSEIRSQPSLLQEGSVALKAGMLLALTLGMTDALASTHSSHADSEGDFDTEMLRQRGIDPRLASYFGAAPRFMPGSHEVQLIVNGVSRGRARAGFDDQGQLCIDAALIEVGGLELPGVGQGDEVGCDAFITRFPHTQIELRPDLGEVDLLVPTEALRATPQDLSGYSTGGTAGLVNYELFGMANRFSGGSNNSASLNSEVGFNAGDWIVRSHQLISSNDGVTQYKAQNAYAQRTFVGIGSVFQAGQIQLANPVLGGAQITGVQLLSEQALGKLGGQARVEGLARGPARVEVSQSGSLIYTTLVPGGPFTLANVPRVNQRLGLDVTVIEADGEQHSFTVSAAQAGVAAPGSGYVAGIGQLRNVEGASSTPVASVGWTGALGRNTSISTGALGSSDYGAAGVSLGQEVWRGAQARVDLVGTNASSEGVKGAQTRMSLSQRLGDNWSLNGAVTHQTMGYRELQEATLPPVEDAMRTRNRNQFDAGVGWSHAYLGSFNANYSQGSLFDGSKSSRAGLSWGTTIKGASLSVTAERELGGVNDQGSSLYATLSIPLGERRRLRTSLRDSNGVQRVGATVNESVSDTFAYRVGAERNLNDGSNSLSLGTSLLPRYAQVELGYSGDGGEQRSFTTGVRGGLLIDGGGITPSAYPLSDSFGVVSVGGVSGVKVNTPSGPAWTDGKGRAVVAQLNAYSRNTVEVVAKSLPRNVDILDGVAQLNVGRGAVGRAEMRVEVTRRVLLEARDTKGVPLPAGAMVTDNHDQPIGIIEQDGQLFLPNATTVEQLWVSAEGQPRCSLQFSLPAQADPHALYETLPATCRIQ